MYQIIDFCFCFCFMAILFQTTTTTTTTITTTTTATAMYYNFLIKERESTLLIWNLLHLNISLYFRACKRVYQPESGSAEVVSVFN